MMKAIPYRPAVSNVLIKASANSAFCARLLSNAHDVLAEMKLPPEDVELLTNIQAASLQDYARQLRTRLLANQV